MATSIDPREIEHFSKDAGRWWDESGPFRPLHKLNPVRLRYIRGHIGQHYGLDEISLKPFKGLEILDIGCGGGLVCEPLARLGAAVTGIDADKKAIEVAREHAAKSGLKITYETKTPEDLLPPSLCYDAVLALEILEHVENVEEFVQNSVNLCKPGGLVIFSTLNRTPQSFALGIVAAEYILGWVPRGTHSWKKFIRPSELAGAVRTAGAQPVNLKGLKYSPLTGDFDLSGEDTGINYFMAVKK